MTDVAARRRAKLLERSKQLSQTGGNPNTKPTVAPEEPKPQEITSAEPSPPIAEAAIPATQAPVQEVPVLPPAPKVDYNLIQELQNKKTTFQNKKRVYRLFFSALCGFVFHYLYVTAVSSFFTLPSFAVTIVLFYRLLGSYEYRAFKMPIEVSFHERKVCVSVGDV